MSITYDPATPGAAAPARPVRASPLRSNLNLIRELAVTTFRLKYTGSVLGYAWSLVKPLLIFGMTYIVFSVFFHAGGADKTFPRQLLLGIVVWTFFADSTVSSIGSIVNNGHIIRKAYFPRWIPVVASTLSAAMTLAVNLLLMIAIGLPLGWYAVGLHTLLLPLFFVELYVLVIGIGLLVSSLFVFFRDLGHVWEIALNLLFYGSAVVFSVSIIPARFVTLVMVNPMAQIIEDMRRSLVSTSIPWTEQILGGLSVIPYMIVLGLAGLGIVVFRRSTPRFGEAL